jgi:hypothetical protein
MTPEELGRLFESFRSSAFRLECLPEYAVTEDDEAEAFRQWRAGQQPQSRDRAWPKLVASSVAAGKRMQRVRIISAPMTEYQRFQCSHGYPANVAAGEEILILDHEPAGLLKADFWIFDDVTAVVLEYDEQGHFLRPVVAEKVAPYRKARDMALESSVPFREYQLSVQM